jgi:hypothetical protein
MNTKIKQIIFYIFGILGLIKLILLIITGSVLGILVTYTSWMAWFSFVLFVVFMWFFYKFAFKNLYSINFMIIILVSIAIIVSIVGFSTGGIKLNNGQTNKNLSPAENKTGGLTDNYIKCDIGDKKGLEFKMSAPSYATNHNNPYSNVDPVLGETILLSFDKNGVSVMASFPGKAPTSYTLVKDEKAGYGINYGIGTTGQSFSTNYENGDRYQVNVTKYSGNIIEGTFSGGVTDLNNKNTKVSLKNCSFKSSLPIGNQ